VPKALKLSGLAVLFALGVLLASTLGASGRVAETTTLDTTFDTTADETATAETTTESAPATETTTEVATTTVQVTTTRILPLPTTGITTESSSDNGTEDWVWVLLVILAVGLITLIFLLARRGRGGVSPQERRHQLDAAVGSWAAQGWAVVSETADSAVLTRGDDSMLLSVDQAGHVSTRPLPPT